MTSEVQVLRAPVSPAPLSPVTLPLPWKDPHEVSREELAGHIVRLEEACLANPQSADLRTCLGMAYAMNFDAYKSMDALERARELDAGHFWAQIKYAELHFRLRALDKAKLETLRALDLASNQFEVATARRQLAEIRRLQREGTQKPAWTKSLRKPSLVLAALLILSVLKVVWK